MKTVARVLFLALIIIAQSSYAHAKKDYIVGILGDAHGDIENTKLALEQMQKKGVTHIIGTGDFIEWGGEQELNKILSMIPKITGVKKDNTFLMPGNWEHETSLSTSKANEILGYYGSLICEHYDSYGIIEIANKKLMVSHFPQSPLPKGLIPPKKFLKRIPGQAFILDTMEKGIHPPEDVIFGIFAHTHIAANYIDPTSMKYLINPGVINKKRKLASEVCSVAIYYVFEEIIKHINIQNGEVIKETQLTPSNNYAYDKAKIWDQIDPINIRAS